MRLTSAWYRLTAPTTEGDLARRQEAVLLNVLAGLAALSLVLQVIQLVKVVSHTGLQGFVWWGVNACFFAGLVGLMALARRGRHRMAASLLVSVLGLLAFAILLADGLNNSMWPAVLGLCVVLAAILFRGHLGLSVAAGSAAVVVVVGALMQAGVFEPIGTPPGSETAAANGVAVATVLGFIAIACVGYVRDATASVDEILAHGSKESPLRELRTSRLSVRELEVVQLVAEGLQDKEIAARLFISTRTVQSHVQNARAKTRTPNRTALGILAVTEGLVSRERVLSVEATNEG